ncbi:MAG: ThuA domain-containing protein [Verrucomicrobia bacterium]|nr:MAG: ThuA domain-containing protein [Verrucomicrobiota bacterium]
MKRFASLLSALLLAVVLPRATAAPIKVLLVDGQNNHAWKATSPVIRKILEDTGRFTVDVATSPLPKTGAIAGFKPRFADYQVVVSNYNGEPWSDETKAAFVAFVRNGGGFVSVHAADNAFPEWKEYNEMIGVGGWGGRNEKSGPYVVFKDGILLKGTLPGGGGGHGSQHDFLVVTREPKHPIVAGLPAEWLHVKDELYHRLRGPADNLTVLATAFSSPSQGGTGENEPMLMVTRFGKGRAFHTTLGHSVEAMNCVGAATVLARGVEWAATGKVTQKPPADFPTADHTSSRK